MTVIAAVITLLPLNMLVTQLVDWLLVTISPRMSFITQLLLLQNRQNRFLRSLLVHYQKRLQSYLIRVQQVSWQKGNTNAHRGKLCELKIIRLQCTLTYYMDRVKLDSDWCKGKKMSICCDRNRTRVRPKWTLMGVCFNLVTGHFFTQVQLSCLTYLAL